jgi:hypothetical protein
VRAALGIELSRARAGVAAEVLPFAEYAIVDSNARSVNVNLQRVALDRVALCKSVLEVDYPLAAFLSKAYA